MTMYALRSTDAHLRERPFEEWVKLRVEATAGHADAADGSFVDPFCGHVVASRFVNGIWQWMHTCELRRSRGRR